MMKISNTILAVFQLTNEMSAKAANKFMANLDYIFYVCDKQHITKHESTRDDESVFNASSDIPFYVLNETVF